MLLKLTYRLLSSSALATALITSAAAEHAYTDPVVARVEMKLAIEEKVVDVIEQGDLLTVIAEGDDTLTIRTHDGTEGVIEKVNAVKIAESVDVYTDLIQRNPAEGRYFTFRAGAWHELGKPEKALEDFDKAIELGYEEVHAYNSRGLFHSEMGNYEEAIADFNQAIELDPKDIAAIINRASVKMSQRDFDGAAEDFSAALDLKPDAISLLHQRALAFKAAGKFAEAIEDFDAILELKPGYHAAVNGRGYIHFQQQQFDSAVEDFTTAIELNPEDPVAWNNRGYNRQQLGQHTEALEDYNKAISLAPEYAQALQNRAWLLAIVDDKAVHDPQAAIDSATAACELTNYESVYHLSALAAALAADGKFDKAVGWQEKVVEMSSEKYREFAEKTLARYQNERPYALDPDQANAEEKAAAEQEGKENQQAKSAETDESNA